ncbi:MAG: hypothetical protein ABGW90_12095 [Martelella sp.]
MTRYYAVSTKGFYDSRIHHQIPGDATEISDAEYHDLVNGQGYGRVIDVVDGRPTLVDRPANIDLPLLRENLIKRVDRAAENIRSRHITPGAGQAMAYLAKAEQAKAYLTATDPVEADYPLLAVEVGITGETLVEVATVVDAAYRQWIVIGGAIEAVRLAAKRDVAAAETAAAAQAVFDAIEWPDNEESGA